jgi:hypothetical protein
MEAKPLAQDTVTISPPPVPAWILQPPLKGSAAAKPGGRMDLPLEPLFDRVMVKRFEPEEMTKGGIIPTKPRRSPARAVLAVGPGRDERASGSNAVGPGHVLVRRRSSR